MFTAAALALLLAAPNDTYTLKWKLAEGDTFYNKTNITMDQTVEVMGQKVDQTITMKAVVRFKVKAAKPGATPVEMTYLEFAVDAAGLPGANIGDKLKGLTFTATLNDKMEVTKLEGYDKFLDALSDGDEAQRKLLKAMLPESTIRQGFSQTFVLAPAKPLAVGDTWEQTEKMAMGPLGNAESKATLKLTGVKDNVATVTAKADLTFTASDADAGLPFKITKFDLKADKFTATHLFDIKAGRVTATKTEAEMSGSMTISAGGMEIDAKLKQKMKVTGAITDKNPIVD